MNEKELISTNSKKIKAESTVTMMILVGSIFIVIVIGMFLFSKEGMFDFIKHEMGKENSLKNILVLPENISIPILETIEGRAITSTDVYYLAKSIDESLIQMHDLYKVFDKEYISKNVKPRNVYQRAVSLADEFHNLHPKVMGNKYINKKLLGMLKQVDPGDLQPKHVYSVLNLIKQHLIAENKYVAFKGKKSDKEPSDVYHMLRQTSFHHMEIARNRNPIPWNNSARVFDANFFEIYSILFKIADEQKASLQKFKFPLIPAENIRPQDVYKSQLYLDDLLKKYYYLKDPSYVPIDFESTSDVNSIDPNDVFDLTQIIIAELKSRVKEIIVLDKQTLTRYYNWKNKKRKVTPGDVYNLTQHNIFFMEKILNEMTKEQLLTTKNSE